MPTCVVLAAAKEATVCWLIVEGLEGGAISSKACTVQVTLLLDIVWMMVILSAGHRTLTIGSDLYELGVNIGLVQNTTSL